MKGSALRRDKVTGYTALLPATVFVSRVMHLDDHLKGMTMVQKQHQMFGMWTQLCMLLKAFHMRQWYVRDVMYSNVVHATIGALGGGWTLLEFSNVSKETGGTLKESMSAWQISPEVRAGPCTGSRWAELLP
jgi:hypothetical protein